MKFLLALFALLGLVSAETIFQVLENDSRFSKLVFLIDSSGVQLLRSNEGSYTLFAPTDEAFSKFDQTELEAIQNDSDRLRNFVLYLIYGNLYEDSDFSNEMILEAQNTDGYNQLRINVYEGRSTVNGVLISSSLAAENGIIYPVDTVIRAPNQTITQIVQTNVEFSIMYSLMETVKLDGILNGGGPLTLFLPTDDAFNALSSDFMNDLENDNNLLGTVLLYHVFSGAFFVEAFAQYPHMLALEGSTLQFSLQNDTITINQQADILIPNIVAMNGVVHVIDTVLIPPSLNVPSTPTVNVPTVVTPTLAPTVNTPTTLPPTVNTPTTMAPTVNTPTTMAPTVNTPTTRAPTANPSTMAPTSNAPTMPATSSPTNVPTVNVPTNITEIAISCLTDCPFSCANVEYLFMDKQDSSELLIWNRLPGSWWYPDCNANDYEVYVNGAWEPRKFSLYTEPLSASSCGVKWRGKELLPVLLEGDGIRFTYDFVFRTCSIEFQYDVNTIQ